MTDIICQWEWKPNMSMTNLRTIATEPIMSEKCRMSVKFWMIFFHLPLAIVQGSKRCSGSGAAGVLQCTHTDKRQGLVYIRHVTYWHSLYALLKGIQIGGQEI